MQKQKPSPLRALLFSISIAASASALAEDC